MAPTDGIPQDAAPIVAIVPAAGRSRRMGAPKQELDVGGHPMLEAVFAPLIACPEVSGVIVVTHRAVADDLGLQHRDGIQLLFNDDPESAMIDSIRIALRHLRSPGSWFSEGENAGGGVLIVPGDQPGMPVEALSRCIAAFRPRRNRIVIATKGGRRGHPIVFGPDYFDFVLSPLCDGGLKSLPREHDENVFEVPCAAAAVLRNINTPEDYRELSDSGEIGKE